MKAGYCQCMVFNCYRRPYDYQHLLSFLAIGAFRTGRMLELGGTATMAAF